jgi:hypothetical protein
LAAALAKAQAEIANPEKSLSATIVSPFPREGSRTFRYASLSSGLDLVRKCLGRHEIATVQVTAIDGESGLIRLTTTLVHASGEWVASDWPVCPVSETAAPHRLGAALTYARRYGLFTLVGIAGEDDLDAPDLPAPSSASKARSVSSDQGAGRWDHPLPSDVARRPARAAAKPSRTDPSAFTPLSLKASERLRQQLLTELAPLIDADALAEWAHRALPLKNQLIAEDAQMVEAAFTARLGLPHEGRDVSGAPADYPRTPPGQLVRHDGPAADRVTIIGKPVRERDRDHLRFVASQPCLVCGRTPSDPHHIKFAEPRAMGRKVSDRFTVPVCRLHHRELHRRGNERHWWRKNEIDPLAIAANLWAATHALAPSEVDVAREIERPLPLNGRSVAQLAERQIYKTNPIRPEGR